VIFDNCSANDENTEPSRVDTEISPKINEKTNISEINKDNILDISIKSNISDTMSQNVTLHLIQPDNNMSALIKLNSQILIGMIPIVASTLMSLLSEYIFLTLLIIAIMWFIILRHTWEFKRKSDQLRDMWV